MKLYRYKNEDFTLQELEHHPECTVAGHELRRNLWRKKLPVAEAMTTPIKLTRSKAKNTYYYQGLMLTVAELSELPECKVTYYQLHKNLQRGLELEDAFIGKIKEPEKKVQNISRSPIEPREITNKKAYGGCISFNPATVRLTQVHTYEWLVLERLGFEMDDFGINMEKSIDKYLL